MVISNNNELDYDHIKLLLGVVLTTPLSLEEQQQQLVAVNNVVSHPDNDDDDKAKTPTSNGSSILQRIISLFRNVNLGSDLTRFQLPPQFNIPKSQLQLYGESVCCVNRDLLGDCVSATTSLARMVSVVAWSFSTLRPLPFGVAPYNPVLGETHHLSRGHLHVLLEQVSHHPPVTALHGTDDHNKIELLWCQYPTSKFHGTSIETNIHGSKRLSLVGRGETYVMNSPKLLIKLLPIPGVEWVGNVDINCQETGLRAELCFKSSSFFRFRGSNNSRCVKGKILDSSTSKTTTLYEINGRWDGTIQAKDIKNGTTSVIYDAKETISMLPTPLVTDLKEGILRSESALVWGEVSKGIMSRDWDKAQKAKKTIEEKQRELAKQRLQSGKDWVPKHFTLTHDVEINGWNCIPINKQVQPSSIVVPIL